MIEKKFLEATKNILEKNLEIIKNPYSEKKIVLVYDDKSLLSPSWCRNKHQQMFKLKGQLKLHNLCY